MLQFLAGTLRSVDPSPQTVRSLAAEVVRFMFSGNSDNAVYFSPLARLVSCGVYRTIIAEEISAAIAALVASEEAAKRLNGLRLAVTLDVPALSHQFGMPPSREVTAFWRDQVTQNVHRYAKDIVAAAADHTEMRYVALEYDLITGDDALKMDGALRPLLQIEYMRVFNRVVGSIVAHLLYILIMSITDEDLFSRKMRYFFDLGKYISDHPQPPWATRIGMGWLDHYWNSPPSSDVNRSTIDPWTYLGVAAAVLIMAEFDEQDTEKIVSTSDDEPSRLGPFNDLYAYMHYRLKGRKQALPELPVPDEFKQLFHDWAERKVNLTARGPRP